MSRRTAASASAPAASTSRATLQTRPAPLRRGAVSNRLPFRKSLIQAGESYEEFNWEERDDLIRRPAQSALAGLLQVGEEDDMEGLNSGRIKRYEAFKSLKLAYLSDSLFLSTSFLLPFHPRALQDPLSPLSTLIKLSNLTTFLYLLLSSAPDAQGNRSRISSSNLEQAALGFLVHIVPADNPIHDGVLKMLLHIKCQSYLAARANSRKDNSPPASSFFSADLATYLPPSTPTSSLSNRGSTIRFKTFSLDLIRQAEAVNGDIEVLETIWRWEDCQNELREYCTAVANSSFGGEESESGSGSGSQSGEEGVETLAQRRRRELEEAEESSDDEPEETFANDPRRSDSIVAELLGATSPSKFRKLSSPLVGRRGVPIAAVEEASSSSDDDEEEESEEAEPEAESLDPAEKQRLMELNDLLDGDDSEEESLLPEQKQRLSELNDLLSEDESLEGESLDTQTKHRLAELLPLLDTSSTVQDDGESQALNSRTNELYQQMNASVQRQATMDLSDEEDELDELEEEEQEEEEEMEVDDSAEKAFAALDAQDAADALDVARQLASGNTVVRQAGGVVRIQADHSLAFGPAKVVKRSLLDRQEDAVRIDFDTQDTHSSLDVEQDSSLELSQRITRAMKGKGRAITPPPPTPASPIKKSKKASKKKDVLVEQGRSRVDEEEEVGAVASGSGMQEMEEGRADPDFFDSGDYAGGGDDGYEPTRRTRPDEDPADATRTESPESRKRRRIASEARDQNSQPSRRVEKRGTVVDDDSEDGEVIVERVPVAGPSRALVEAAGYATLSDSDDEDDPKTIARRKAFQAKALEAKARAEKERAKKARTPSYEFDDDPSQARERKRQKERDPFSSDDEDEPAITNFYRIKRDDNTKLPYTEEETELLIAEMQLFGSSNWTEMCERHGSISKPKGSLSSTFRDRNNVSLRDKARALKRGYMTRLEEVPAWLDGIAVSEKSTKKLEEARAREDAWKKTEVDSGDSEGEGVVIQEVEEEEEEE